MAVGTSSASRSRARFHTAETATIARTDSKFVDQSHCEEKKNLFHSPRIITEIAQCENLPEHCRQQARQNQFDAQEVLN
jgi:hypothetical protein